jgi:hypothetical protein
LPKLWFAIGQYFEESDGGVDQVSFDDLKMV